MSRKNKRPPGVKFSLSKDRYLTIGGLTFRVAERTDLFIDGKLPENISLENVNGRKVESPTDPALNGEQSLSD